MSKLFFKVNLLAAVLSVAVTGGCAVEAAKMSDADQKAPVKNSQTELSTVKAPAKMTKGASIEITANSPADTVRVFYKHLRENRFRDAMFLTNLRPAIEGLTDSELADLQLDLAKIAQQIPSEIEINGEIISGNYATVTAKLPDNETKQLAIQELRLRNAGDYWVILTVDEEAEGSIKKEGNKYFFNLRLQTYEAEAKAMIERISKAQVIYSLQKGGVYGELGALVALGFLPEDVLTSDSTGYNYKVVLTSDKTKYYATAEPAVFGKTGKLSFLLDLDDKKNPRLTSKENNGQPLKK
jgi:hypothetical protein